MKISFFSEILTLDKISHKIFYRREAEDKNQHPEYVGHGKDPSSKQRIQRSPVLQFTSVSVFFKVFLKMNNLFYRHIKYDSCSARFFQGMLQDSFERFNKATTCGSWLIQFKFWKAIFNLLIYLHGC